MKSFIYMALGTFLILMSCNKNHDTNEASDVSDLFNKSAETIVSFINEIKSAKDSLQVDSLFNAYEKRITEINFSFPPETDLKLSEQDNDSLFILQKKLKSVITEKKRELSFVPVDSVMTSID